MLQISEGGCGLRIMGVIPTETPENRRVVQWLTLFFLPVFPVSAGIIRLEPVTNGGPSPFKLLKRESIPWERVPRTLLFAYILCPLLLLGPMVIAVFLFQLGYNWLMLPLLLASLIWLFYAIWKIGKWHDERLTLRLPVAKLWGLATGGPQIILNEESFDCLATIYGKDECREILQRSWGIQGESEVEPMLSWLFQEGHSAECLSILENERRDLVIESEDPQGRIQFALDHRDQFQQHGLAAWDCGRIVAVAKWSCCAGYLSEGKAWEWIARSSQRIQCEYSSWAEFGEHWILGFRYWSDGKETDSDWTKAIDWLLKSKKSPWLNLAWDTELS